MGVYATGRSANYYDLVPVGDRITYTIDISTPEGQQKLRGLNLAEAQRLAETEACRKYNCDRLIDPRFDYLNKGKRILYICKIISEYPLPYVYQHRGPSANHFPHLASSFKPK